MSALTAAPEGEDGHPGEPNLRPGGGSHNQQQQQQQYEQDGEDEEEQHRQLQLLRETTQELEEERFEEEEREARLRALRMLTPEEYLQQTGVSSAMEEALGLVAGLRPCTPLNLFSDIMRDKARNTHPAVRQAKLLRYVVGPSVRRGAAATAAAAAATATSATVDTRSGTTHPSVGAGYSSPAAKGNTTTTAAGGKTNRPREEKNTAAQQNHHRFYSQLEVLCEPLHRSLCGGKNSGFAMTTEVDRDNFDATAAALLADNFGGRGGRSGGRGPNRTGAGTSGGSGTNKPGFVTGGGRVRGGGKGAGGSGGGTVNGAGGGPRGSGGGSTADNGGGGSGGGGGGRGGARARWHEVRRFLEALCRAAEMDAECTAAAMAVLEREGRFSSNSPSSSSAAPPSSYSTPAPSKKTGGGVVRAGGRWTPPEVGVDFRRFVAAVRAVLLFEGFYREARQAFLEVAGRVDSSAPLDELLERLFPSHPSENTSGSGCKAREAIRERLDVRRRGETKVRLSTLTDCVLSSSFHTP